MLERAISNLTLLLAEADDPQTAADLVSERAAMRAELAALRGKPRLRVVS